MCVYTNSTCTCVRVCTLSFCVYSFHFVCWSVCTRVHVFPHHHLLMQRAIMCTAPLISLLCMVTVYCGRVGMYSCSVLHQEMHGHAIQTGTALSIRAHPSLCQWSQSILRTLWLLAVTTNSHLASWVHSPLLTGF